MTPKWYARKPDAFLYDQPRAEPWQVERARSFLERRGGVPVNDLDAHLGALTMLKDHLLEVLRCPVPRRELMCRIATSCDRPGFHIEQPQPSRYRAGHWMWIDPATIARGALGASFSPFHDSIEELAIVAERVLVEQGDPDGLSQIFGHPRNPEPGVVAVSIPGPFGPVRPIADNGNHRTLALEALGAPVILARVHRFGPPYRCRVHQDDDWRATLAYLRWLEFHEVLRLATRPFVRSDPWVYLRVAEAPTPWLACSPGDALAAVSAYEQFYRRQIERIGEVDLHLLRERWGASELTHPVADHSSLRHELSAHLGSVQDRIEARWRRSVC